MASEKVDFAARMRSSMGTLHNALTSLRNLTALYFDRGYNSGGADPIEDADIVAQEVTAAQIASGITAAQQLDNFRDSAVVTPGDYDSTINKLRRLD